MKAKEIGLVGEHESLAELTTAANEGEAGVIRAVLRARGIESWQHTASTVMLGVWGASGFNATTVRVRASDLERAREAIENARQDSVDLDWNEVDVGEPEDALAADIAARDHGVGGGGGFVTTTPGRVVLWAAIIAAALLMTGPPGAMLALVFALVSILRRARLRRRYER